MRASVQPSRIAPSPHPVFKARLGQVCWWQHGTTPSSFLAADSQGSFALALPHSPSLHMVLGARAGLVVVKYFWRCFIEQ